MCFMRHFELQELIDFAKKNHEQFKDFSDENIAKFFEVYAKTIIVRQNKADEITGFCVWLPNGEKKIEIVTICLSGDNRKNNIRDIRAFLYRWNSVQIKVTWKRTTTGSNIFGLLANIYDYTSA